MLKFIGTIALVCWFGACFAFIRGETVSGQTNISYQKDLSKKLLDNYGSTALRPVKNISTPVSVFFRILIAQVIDFNEKEQQITINGWRKMTWKDDFLTWDPREHGGIDMLEISPYSIWLPDIKLYENIDKDFQSEDAVNAIVTSDGMVEWYTPMVVSSSCKINVRYFPFDDQKCVMTFASWAYDIGSLNLNYSSDATQNVFLNNGVWDLRKIHVQRQLKKYACCPNPFTFVVVETTLQRRYEFYVFNMVVPCIMLSAINALVFLVPPESGEKISFSVANLLASILFQQLIGELMPPLGDEIPLLGMFFLYMVAMSCVALGASVMVLRMFHRLGVEPVPAWLRQVFLRRRARSESMRRANAAFRQSAKHLSMQDGWKGSNNMNDIDMTSDNPVMVMQHIHEKNQAMVFHDSDDDDESALFKREVICQEWKTVARKLDKLMGALVAVATVIVIFIILLCFVFKV